MIKNIRVMIKNIMIIIMIIMMITREEELPEELVALMEDMKSAQKKANLVTLKLIMTNLG